jgi:TetR/AcrR family transcriptional repressor of nem operon
MTTQSPTETDARILDVAERLVQQRGYNAFSYADVAIELDLTKASLHYHFSSKATLGLALVDRYSTRFLAALETIAESAPTAAARLAGYTGLYASVLRQDRMCLCGMLAADYPTIPEPMRAAVLAFFQRSEEWLATAFVSGENDGSLAIAGNPVDAAATLVGAIEGAMLVARAFDDPERFERSARRILTALEPSRTQPVGSASAAADASAG